MPPRKKAAPATEVVATDVAADVFSLPVYCADCAAADVETLMVPDAYAGGHLCPRCEPEAVARGGEPEGGEHAPMLPRSPAPVHGLHPALRSPSSADLNPAFH